MTTTSTAESIKAKQEVEGLTAQIMRLMADTVVEQKRAVVTEIDRLVAAEEATWAVAEGRQH